MGVFVYVFAFVYMFIAVCAHTYTHILSPYGCTHITEYITLHSNCLFFLPVMFSRLCSLRSIFLSLYWQRLTNALFAFFYLITLFSGFLYTYTHKHQQITCFQRLLRKTSVFVKERSLRLTQSINRVFAQGKRLPKRPKWVQSQGFTNTRSYQNFHTYNCQQRKSRWWQR